MICWARWGDLSGQVDFLDHLLDDGFVPIYFFHRLGSFQLFNISTFQLPFNSSIFSLNFSAKTLNPALVGWISSCQLWPFIVPRKLM
jgi:hypothetical protein